MEKGQKLRQLAKALIPKYSKSLDFKNLLWSFPFILLSVFGSSLTMNLEVNMCIFEKDLAPLTQDYWRGMGDKR